MQVKILYFANVREIVGCAEEFFECADGLDVDRLFKMVVEKYAKLGEISEDLALALNAEYLDGHGEGVALSDKDEVAIIPPVSGG